MRVMHVSLGLPPLRTGGMTRYCTELSLAQVEHGDEVALLYPGRFLPGRTRIAGSTWKGIRTFEVINPLPVPLVYGIAEPGRFTKSCDDPTAYEWLLDEFRPDAIHVHCYQGIHREFFDRAKERHIPLLFTTHDYYPMCPRCTLITSTGDECERYGSAKACAACNAASGMTVAKSVIMQSRVYARLKESRLVADIGRRVKRDMSHAASGESDKRGENSLPEEEYVKDYERLLEYNRSIFSLFDLVLTNSRLTEEVYRKSFPGVTCERLPITHAGLSRSGRALKQRESGHPLKTAYFGGEKRYKGFDTLMDAADILARRGVCVELRLYGDDYMHCELPLTATAKGKVPLDGISMVIRESDVVCVPSRYHETFGFVVLESLCEGVPVICSDVVGASDLVPENLKFESGNPDSLAKTIEEFAKSGVITAEISSEYPLSMMNQVLSVEKLIRTYFHNDEGGKNAL